MALDPISTILAAALLAPIPPSTNRLWEDRQRSNRSSPSDTDKPLVASSPATSQIYKSGSPLVVDIKEQLFEVVDVYSRLPAGWDGPRSVTPSPASVDAARSFVAALPGGIPVPTPMVTASGEVGFYWDLQGGYADISFGSDGFGSFFARDSDGAEVFIPDLNVRHMDRKWFFDKIGGIAVPPRVAA
jgi:hypothetical protein